VPKHRQEASEIPNLLVAPKEYTCGDDYEGDIRNYGGWYEDGAYYSSTQLGPSSDATDEENGETWKDPQLAYFDSILRRYETLRAQLEQTPPIEAVQKLGKDHPTHLGRLNKELARWWRWNMRTVDPLPAQIANMDKSTVLRLLGLLTGGTLLKRGAEVDVGVSRWAWGLLARLPDRGELTSEEIGVVRELGKKAVLVGMGLREERQWEEGMDEVEAGFDDDEADFDVVNEEEILLEVDDETGDQQAGEVGKDPGKSASAPSTEPNRGNENDVETVHEDQPTPREDLTVANGEASEMESVAATNNFEDAKARLLERLQNKQEDNDIQYTAAEPAQDGPNQATSAKWNTRATVDMIITVAGEIYGQRDLLEFRENWTEIL
jgi:hypothetical protein